MGSIKGAKESIGKYRPKIIFECALYLLEENGISFIQYYQYFQNQNYQLINNLNGKVINMSNYAKQISKFGTTDIFAILLSNSEEIMSLKPKLKNIN